LCANLLLDATLQADMEASVELAANAGACFKLHGKNIILSDDGRSAERRASYNQGIVISRYPLRPRHVFQVCYLYCSSSLSSSSSSSSLFSAQTTAPVQLYLDQLNYHMNTTKYALKQNCNKMWMKPIN